MLNLQQEQYKQLPSVILSVYPQPSDLNLFVSEQLGENLTAIAGDLPYEEAIAKLVRWAIEQGKIDDLAIALYENAPDNLELQPFVNLRFEQRLATLEAEMAQLKRQFAFGEANADSEPAWWEKMAGIFAEDPAFEEAMSLGREYRQSLVPFANQQEE